MKKDNSTVWAVFHNEQRIRSNTDSFFSTLGAARGAITWHLKDRLYTYKYRPESFDREPSRDDYEIWECAVSVEYLAMHPASLKGK